MSHSDADPATNPPAAPPSAFPRVDVMISTSPRTPKCSAVPRPFGPRTPLPCESSTATIASYSLASSRISGSLQMLPSMENTPSVQMMRRRALRALELRLEVIQIGVLVAGRRALGDRFREPDRVDDRRVIERIGDDEVVLLDDRRGETLVGVPRRYVAERRFGTDEIGDRPLEIAVNRERATDEAYAPRSSSEIFQAVESRRDYCWITAQPEVVVGGEDHDVAAPFHLYAGVLG